MILPPNLDDWLPKDHFARFISSVIDTLDLSEIINYYEVETKGAPPYDPKMMVKIRTYADCIGRPSSRKINKGMVDEIPFRFLGAGNFPDFRTISDFRKIHHKALANLFTQVLGLCDKAGLIKLTTVSLDGTKMKANASIDKNRTMKKLRELENKYEEIARKTIEDGIKTDEEEDEIYGKDYDGHSVPKDALERVRKAMRDLEEEKRKKQEEYQKHADERKKKEEETGKKLRGRKPISPDDKKKKEKKEPVANTTDPDSRIMKTRNGFIQGINSQAAVDADSQIIVAAEVTQDHNDLNQLESMINKVIENTKKTPKNVVADAGYDNSDQIKRLKELCNVLIPTQKDWKQRKAMKEQSVPRGRIPKRLTERERRERALLTKRGKAIYKKRGSSIEPVNGQIKTARGLCTFLLRGIEKVASEWKMYCIGNNLLKLWRHSVIKQKC